MRPRTTGGSKLVTSRIFVAVDEPAAVIRLIEEVKRKYKITADTPAADARGLHGVAAVWPQGDGVGILRTFGVYPPHTDKSLYYATGVVVGMTVGWLEAQGIQVRGFREQLEKMEDYVGEGNSSGEEPRPA